MDARLLVLKLFLEELEVPATISTVDERKRVQKAVYLGQLASVDLGYRFGWYLMGPYCPSLTRDYYALAEALASGEREPRGTALHPVIKTGLRQVAPLLRVPQDVALKQDAWLELLSSLHFLRKVQELTPHAAAQKIKEQKRPLFPWLSSAEAALKKAKVLS